MDSQALLTVGILSAIGFCLCQNELLLNGPLNGAVGESVKFTLINPPSTRPNRITWSVRGNRDVTIFTSVGGGEDTHADYVGRISVDKITASLELRNLTHNDTGLYTVRISIISGGAESRGDTSLTVFERISGAAMTITDGILIAGESSVNLTCDAQGSIITREWTKDGSPLHGVNIDELNRTVSISPVKKEDKGDYTCKISNPISSETVSIGLIVNYGPEKVNIMGGGAIEIGSPVHLTCTAESVPESTYTWAFNGRGTNVTGALYVKEPSEYEDSGTYTCTALNSITKHKDDAVFELSVKAQYVLPDGAIVGIVFLIIIVFAVVIGISLFLLKKNGKISFPKCPQAPQQNNASELDYADIRHFQKRNGQREDLGNGGDGGVAGATVYAAVKLPSSTGPHPGQTSAALPRAGLGNGANVGDQNTELQCSTIKHPTSSMSGPQAHRPKGQAPGPPNQVPDVTYAQVKKN